MGEGAIEVALTTYLYPFLPALQPQHKYPGALKTGHLWICSPCEGHWSAWGRGNGLSLDFIPGSPGTFPYYLCGFCFVI